MKKTVALILASLAIQTSAFAAEIQWVSTSGTIPNDGNIYYITTSITLAGNINVLGTLEIRNGGTINFFNPGSPTPYNVIVTGGSIKVLNGGTISISDGNTISTLKITQKGYVHVCNGGVIDIAILEETKGKIEINQDGSVVVYPAGLIRNTISGLDGTIEINSQGILYILGGTVQHEGLAAKTITNPGGTIYNDHGTLITTPGTLTIKPGGTLHNIKGTLTPTGRTINPGGIFIDEKETTITENLDLDCTWTITGQKVINGNGNTITLEEKGAIVIDTNSSLLLENINIEGITENNIRCLDNTGTLSLDNTNWQLDDSYSFTQGTLYAKGDWTITSNNATITYSSSLESIIKPGATLTLDQTTLKYNSENQDDLIKLPNPKSVLHLKRGKLIAEKPWKLSLGTLVTTGATTLQGNELLDLRNLDSIYMNVATLETGNVLFPEDTPV